MKEEEGNSGLIDKLFTRDRLLKFQEENPNIMLNLHDHVQLPFSNEDMGIEWMWVLVDVPDNENKIGYGRLDNDPWPGSELEYGQPIEFEYKYICNIIRSEI